MALCLVAAVLSASSSLAADNAMGAAKAEVCVACHGPNGNSSTAAIPSLAAQPKQFITTQLVMFREGRRVNEQMWPFVAKLTNADINDLGTYFAAQPLATPPRATSPEALKEAARLATRYNCNQCHGSDLKGLQHIPRLAGQHAEYLRAQLRGFRAGTRFDMDGNMTSAAQPLSDADIDVLANWFAAIK